MGGQVYLKNLIYALCQLDEEHKPKLSLILESVFPPSLKTLPVDQVLQIPAALHSSPPNLRGRIFRYIRRKLRLRHSQKNAIGLYLQTQGVDCVFAKNDFGPHFSIPLLAWIADFQHLHMSEMFSPQELQDRDASFAQAARYGTRIILSSQHALRDFQQFAPYAASKGRVLSFVAQVPAEVYETNPRWVCDQYHLPERFFYLPNQFWKHKNHAVVIDALSFLNNTHPDIVVVCTGPTNDHRDPQHFGQILATVAEKNLRNNFLLLGLVPHAHTFSLMRQSLAIVQPSLFEGWSTTVEETKSLGKRIILSDIEVHREQNPADAIYFNPHSAEELSTALIQAHETAVSGPDILLEEAARVDLKVRTAVFGKNFVDIFREVVSA